MQNELIGPVGPTAVICVVNLSVFDIAVSSRFSSKMDFKNDDDLTKLIQQMAEKEGLTLASDQIKALMDCLEPFTEDDCNMSLASDSLPLDNSLDSTSLEDASEEMFFNSQESKTTSDFGESEESSSTCAKNTQFLLGHPIPAYFPIEELQPRLLRRIRMPNPPLPNYVLDWIRKPRVLWFIMQRMVFGSYGRLRKSLRSKNAVRNLYWKAALAAAYGCYDAFFFLKHAALRCTRKDLKSAFQLHNVAMTHILKKIMLDINKKIKHEKLKTREALSETEVIPLTFRKYYRSRKRVCKVKALWVHYLYRDRSLIKKPYRVMNAILKQSITEIAFSNTKNRYPRKYIHPQDIAEDMVISDYEDGTSDRDYTFHSLLCDEDNLYLREDVSRILKRSKIRNPSNLKQNDKKQPDLRGSYHLENNDKDSMDQPNACDITKFRLDNFFRLFHGPLIRIILEQHLASGELKDWIDEIDLPILIDDIENLDKLAKKKKSKCNDPTDNSTHSNTILSDTDSKEFDKMVHSVLTQGYSQTTTATEVPLGLEKYVNGEDYCGIFIPPVVKSDSCKEEEAELFQEIQNRYVYLVEKEREINIDEQAGPSTSSQNQATRVGTEDYAELYYCSSSVSSDSS